MYSLLGVAVHIGFLFQTLHGSVFLWLLLDQRAAFFFFFSVKGQIVYMLALAGLAVSAVATLAL